MRSLRIVRDSSGSGRAGYMVQFRPVAIFNARLAGRHRRSAYVLSDVADDHGLRHTVLLGGADDRARSGNDWSGSVPAGSSAWLGARRRTAENVEDQG